jgi:hypothetical protein
MEGVFKLRSVDIYRVLELERVRSGVDVAAVDSSDTGVDS